MIYIFSLDLPIQRWFFNISTHKWLIDNQDRWLRLILYDAAKYIIIAFGLILCARFITALINKNICLDTKAYLLVIICLILIPSIVAFLKQTTGKPCPSQMQEFLNHNSKLFGMDMTERAKSFACFPAGHPSGGFALLATIVVTQRPLRWVLITLLFGIGMSVFQIAVGAHTLSHVTVTIMIASAVPLFIKWFMIKLINFNCLNSEKMTP